MCKKEFRMFKTEANATHTKEWVVLLRLDKERQWFVSAHIERTNHYGELGGNRIEDTSKNLPLFLLLRCVLACEEAELTPQQTHSLCSTARREHRIEGITDICDHFNVRRVGA